MCLWGRGVCSIHQDEREVACTAVFEILTTPNLNALKKKKRLEMTGQFKHLLFDEMAFDKPRKASSVCMG